MKKILSMALILVFLCSFTAFAETPSPSPSSDVTETPTAPPSESPSTSPSPTDVPTVNDMDLTTMKNAELSGTLSATFPEGYTPSESMVFVTVDSAKNGTVKILNNDSGDFTYTPNADYVGTDSFTFQLTDGTVSSNVATATITVKEPETEPSPPVNGIYIDLWNHWAQPAANALTEMGKLEGEKVGNYHYFYPDYILNRAQFVVWANSAFGFEEEQIERLALPFEDLKDAPEWVIRAITPAYKAGLVNGHLENGKLYLEPYAELTRVEAFMMIYNVIGFDAHNNDPIDFADADQIPVWAEQMVKDMKGYGLLKGFDDNTMRPFAKISRGEAAQMLYEAIQYLQSKGNGNSRLRIFK